MEWAENAVIEITANLELASIVVYLGKLQVYGFRVFSEGDSLKKWHLFPFQRDTGFEHLNIFSRNVIRKKVKRAEPLVLTKISWNRTI